MGWRGAMRSLAAAERRHNRAQERREREIQKNANRAANEVARTLSSFERSVERDADRLLTRARQFEEDLAADPIAALQLRFREPGHWESAPFDLGGDVIKGSLSLTTSNLDDSALPEPYLTEGCRISPVGLLLTRWSTIVALKVEGLDQEYRIKPNWVKARSRSESAIYLTGDDQYYYPLASTLGGEIVPEVPKIALIAFERLRAPTDHLVLHISDVKLTKKRGDRHTISFRWPTDQRSLIDEILAKPSLVDEFSEVIDNFKQKALDDMRVHADAASMSIETSRQAGLDSVRAETSPALIAIIGTCAIFGFLILLAVCSG